MTEPISHIALVAALVKPGRDIIDDLTPSKANLLHMVVGISGEAAELQENIEAATTNHRHFDRENAVEEGGDLEFFIEGLYQELQLDRFPIDQRSDKALSIAHAVVRINIAAGKVLDIVKKYTIYNKPMDRTDFIAPLQALERAMGDFRQRAGISRDEMIAGNIKKLSKRYASMSYSNEQAQVRADKVEA